ncbi:MAG: twin-arginine translocase subunit TatC, partial [Gammaproteobacteria bacterium]|nr:twin-arginine translocase subunit TatC [Gammaproteobacteria bacterium]
SAVMVLAEPAIAASTSPMSSSVSDLPTFIFYQAWAFVAPGLYLKEKSLAMPLLISSTLLFYLGIVFCYFVVFPLVFGFFTSAAPEGVTIMTDISKYLDFVLKLFFAFGIAFEVPVATFLIVRTGISTVESLGQKRPYVIVGAFALGMVLTPPDVISQILLAVPIWLLFELGLFLCRNVIPADKDEDDKDEDDMDETSAAEKP